MRFSDGVATTSLPAQGPVGSASGVGVGVPDRFLRPARVGEACGVVTPVVGAADVVDASAPTGWADGLPEPPAPSRCAIPKTSANATTTRSSRRVQYTRAGSGRRGRVTVVMAPP